MSLLKIGPYFTESETSEEFQKYLNIFRLIHNTDMHKHIHSNSMPLCIFQIAPSLLERIYNMQEAFIIIFSQQ